MPLHLTCTMVVQVHLEEIWTKYNPDDKHGVANDLSKIELKRIGRIPKGTQ